MTIHDVIIVGMGAMGSASAFHLARRGARVLGIDRFDPPHAFGSSHGRTRIIRQAYFESPQYVPLVQRAYANWAELERLSQRTLFTRTGGLMIGPPDSAVADGALRSALQHGLEHRVLSAADAREKYPAFRVPDDCIAIEEPDAGILEPEACIAAHLDLARMHGAELRTNEQVLSWRRVANGIEVETTRGTETARRVVFTAGAWMSPLLPMLRLPLTVERVVQHWFTPSTRSAALQQGNLPVFVWEYAPGLAWYGFPLRKEGIKLALHHHGTTCTADDVRRDVSADEIELVRDLVRRFMPDADGEHRESTVCLYTNTPDEDFIFGTPTEWPELLVVSACSGHGFKFSSALGEAVASTIIDGGTDIDLTPFRIERFDYETTQ